MRLPSTLVALAIVVSVAGCGAFSLADTQPGPAIAPGVTNERVTNASTLEAANRAILQNTSYTFVRNYSQRIEADDYRYAVEHDTRVWVGEDGSFRYRHHGVVSAGNHPSNVVDGIWTNGTVAVSRTVNVENESVTYARYRPPEPYTAVDATRSGVAGTLENASVASVRNESDWQYARVRVNESETRQWGVPNGTTVDATTYHDATATVRDDGFVPSLDASVSGTRPLPVAANDTLRSNGRPLARINDSTRVRYTALGSTRVPCPDWVDDALASTDGTSLGQSTSPRPMSADA